MRPTGTQNEGGLPPTLQLWLRRVKRFRTPVLAVIATAMLVSSAVNSFDVPWREIAVYFAVSVAGVLSIALAAFLAVAIFKTVFRR